MFGRHCLPSEIFALCGRCKQTGRWFFEDFGSIGKSGRRCPHSAARQADCARRQEIRRAAFVDGGADDGVRPADDLFGFCVFGIEGRRRSVFLFDQAGGVRRCRPYSERFFMVSLQDEDMAAACAVDFCLIRPVAGSRIDCRARNQWRDPLDTFGSVEFPADRAVQAGSHPLFGKPVHAP